VNRPGSPTSTRLLVSRPPLAVQGTLALDLGSLPSPTGDGPPRTPELDHTRQSRVEHLRDAEVRGWAARFAQAVAESVTGLRPTTQLVRWTSQEVFRDLDRRAQLVRRAAGPVRRPVRPQVRSVHVCCPNDRAAEVSVHVRHGHRSRALALRLERRDDRWVCTALEFG
jgi:Family of unknown function (DUF6459)